MVSKMSFTLLVVSKTTPFFCRFAIIFVHGCRRECSVQEAVYHVMPELWLRKCSPGVLFANSKLPEHRYKMCLNEEEIKELPEDSSNIFKKNMIDRYMDRPNSHFADGKYGAVAFICFADFLTNYYLMRKHNKDLLNGKSAYGGP